MFSKKNDNTRELEKRIEDLERQLDEDMNELRKRTKDQIRDLGDSLRVMKDVVSKVQKEKNEVERDRNFLIEKHKEIIRTIPIDRSKLKKDIREKLLLPLQKKVKENAELVQRAALEGVADRKSGGQDFVKQVKNAVVEGESETKTPIDDLFELIMKDGKVKIPDAAKKFGVFEAQIEEWAKILESHGLIDIHYSAMGRPELRKRTIQPEESKI